MNHSNKSGQPLAESEEGRPLIKENTHQLSTNNRPSIFSIQRPRLPGGNLKSQV
jgi:hypothetical protein